MSILGHILPAFIQKRYRDLQRRLDRAERSLSHLQMEVDALVEVSTYAPGEDVGFNGQRQRKRVFGDVTAALSFEAMVETGTRLGTTAGYMRQTTRRPVHTCELNPRFLSLARLRLADLDQIQFELGDSRAFLRNLALSGMAGKLAFFYLDAHGEDDLPLVEELEIIASNWPQFVVMIDDFQVADDPGYSYDDWGAGKALTLELLRPALAKHGLTVFFPAAPSSEETGSKRGCVVLATHGDVSKQLATLASLRQWPSSLPPTASAHRRAGIAGLAG